MPTTFVVRTPAYRKEGNVCKGNLSWVSLARSVTRPQATGFALQNRTNTKKDTQKRAFFRVGKWLQFGYFVSAVSAINRSKSL